jgi:O-methyltransferase
LKYSIYFIFNCSGREYHIGIFRKIYIVVTVILNAMRVRSLTDPLQQLLIIDEVFKIPGEIKGDIVECGCYNGASTICLSLACALTKRKLFVCDSFAGLPDPGENEKYDVYVNKDLKYYQWEKGNFASEGGMDGVKKNVARYGNIEVCEFVKGYFCNTLKEIKTESIVMVFEDADLASSVRDCLVHLWPKLRENCKFYCHEPWSANIVALFYDKSFWNKEFLSQPPGFFGSGYGITRAGYYTNIGYAIKTDVKKILLSGKKITHTDLKGYIKD